MDFQTSRDLFQTCWRPLSEWIEPGPRFECRPGAKLPWTHLGRNRAWFEGESHGWMQNGVDAFTNKAWAKHIKENGRAPQGSLTTFLGRALRAPQGSLFFLLFFFCPALVKFGSQVPVMKQCIAKRFHSNCFQLPFGPTCTARGDFGPRCVQGACAPGLYPGVLDSWLRMSRIDF